MQLINVQLVTECVIHLIRDLIYFITFLNPILHYVTKFDLM
jgi:hypothetical protein